MSTIEADGQKIQAHAGAPLLEALARAGIDVPTLCHLKDLAPSGACRMCLVEIEGQRGLVTACTQEVAPGMVVRTETDLIRQTRKDILELLLSEHRVSCVTCDKNGDCKLMEYSYRYGADQARFGIVNPGPRRPNYTTGNKAIEYDPQLCIRCGRCVRICDEAVMVHALTFAQRGARTEVSTAFDVPLNDTTCELCGSCVGVCPTGAMYERGAKGKGQCKDLAKVRTTCPYCGVGCQMDLNVSPQTGRIVRVTAGDSCVPNDGKLCVKGRFGFQFVHSPDRLTTPLIRDDSGIGTFRTASWDEALALVGRRMREIRDRHGPDALAFLSSCRCTNEENYLLQKLARTAGKTNNIDQCATTCHAPTVAGLASAYGSGAMTNAIGEIQHVDTLLVIGANPTEAHPIVGMEMKKALRRGAKLVVCDPRRTWVARHAHLHIQHRPGTDNMLVNAMMGHIIDRGLYDREFVAQRCENFEAMRENLRSYPVAAAAEVCGVRAEVIRQAAEMYAAGRPSSIFYTLGITEHTCGTENVQNLANLAMLCGQIGKLSSGINPLRGQNNVQGGCDMGGIHFLLPGYQKIDDPGVRQKFAQAWGVDLPGNRGGRVTDFIQQAEAGIVRGFYCFGEDPVSSEPNQDKVIESFKKLELLVCQEIFLTETAKLAHVVLPASTWAEKDGTFTNTERRVQRVRKAVDPPGQAKADWEIICLVSTAMGYPMRYAGPEAVFDEMARLTPSYAGISYPRIDKVGLQWPCPTPDHPGTPFLHQNRFVRGRGLFHVIAFRPPAEVPDAEYPFVLSTGRTLYHYNVGHQTLASDAIRQKQSENFVQMHVEDARRLGVGDGDLVAVRTRRGRLTVRAAVGQEVRPGALWMPFHFIEQPTNRLTNDAFDNITRTGEYKCCAAAVERT